jgi:hypothetical protein
MLSEPRAGPAPAAPERPEIRARDLGNSGGERQGRRRRTNRHFRGGARRHAPLRGGAPLPVQAAEARVAGAASDREA